ncbi:MAG TPA: DUF3500 domain-containing protein [Verrucomicrobiae bacterium]|nr:DUF3500 domain-containing protein [Verrucomicrobiae bacterium]
MQKHLLLAILFILARPGFNVLAEEAGQSATDSPAGKIEAAAKHFLTTLDAAQREKAQFAFNDAAQRKRWSNLPVSMVSRAGVRMGDLNQGQRDAVWAVLAAALSRVGYEKVRQIVGADERLHKAERDGRAMFGMDQYFVSFLGQPSATEPWMIQFGGHHLALNITLAGKNGTLAPSHTAAQPAIYEIEGKTTRPLGRENDKAFTLINALSEAQRKEAIIGAQMRDLVLGPGRDGQTIQPEGIKGAELNDKQREMLLDLASEWIGIQNEAMAATKMAEVKKDMEQTWFAWSGPTQNGSAAYFRIQGPTVLIEYAPQRLGGEPTKHIHTIYRDPTNEYGLKWWPK